MHFPTLVQISVPILWLRFAGLFLAAFGILMPTLEAKTYCELAVEQFATAAPPQQTLNPRIYFFDVAMQSYLTINRHSAKYLASSKAEPCIILTLYDPTTKLGTVAHYTSVQDFKASTEKMIFDYEQRGIDLSQMEATIRGGYRADADALGQSAAHVSILKKVLKDKNIEIVEDRSLQNARGEHQSVVLDLEDGRTFEPDWSKPWMGVSTRFSDPGDFLPKPAVKGVLPKQGER